GLQPLVGERRRQPHVHDRHVGAELQQALEQLGAALHGRDHLEPVGLEQVDQPVPEQIEVFGDEYPVHHVHLMTVRAAGRTADGLSRSWAGITTAARYMAVPSRIMNTMHGHCHGSGRCSARNQPFSSKSIALKTPATIPCGNSGHQAVAHRETTVIIFQRGSFGRSPAQCAGSTRGSSMVTVVGPPGGLLIAITPSKAASRRSIPARPLPLAGSAPPQPSSVTVMSRFARLLLMSISTDSAPPCRAALASSSLTAKYAAAS